MNKVNQYQYKLFGFEFYFGMRTVSYRTKQKEKLLYVYTRTPKSEKPKKTFKKYGLVIIWSCVNGHNTLQYITRMQSLELN